MCMCDDCEGSWEGLKMYFNIHMSEMCNGYTRISLHGSFHIEFLAVAQITSAKIEFRNFHVFPFASQFAE